MDESLSGQLQIDFFTGQPTALWGPITSSAERAACSALNRERARGILEAFKLSPSGEPLSTDVWTATFTRRAREWSLPLISLTKLGFVREEEGLVCPPSLFALKPGAEAEPYWHRASGMVYKLSMKRRFKRFLQIRLPGAGGHGNRMGFFPPLPQLSSGG